MTDAEKRLEELRQYLDDSIRAYQSEHCVSTNRNRNSISSGGSYGHSVTAHQMPSNRRRILHVLHQDEDCACVQISGAVTTRMPIAAAVAPANALFKNAAVFGKMMKSSASSTAPLQVIVGIAASQQQQHRQGQQSSISASGTNDFMAASPADSVDSGLSSVSSSNSSPASSPGCSPVSNRDTPFQYGVAAVQQLSPQAQPRGRSSSESLCAANGLKSILKKSTPPTYITAGRFIRSYSECQSIEEENLKTAMIDEGNAHQSGSVCCPRKKHVSFSERLVQERSFRPNSSILGQKKKNQRKQKNKLKKRCGALAPEDSSTDDEIRHRSDSEMSQDTLCAENECNDETDPIVCDLAACEIDDAVVLEEEDDGNPDNTMHCCYHGAAKIRERILRSSTGEERIAYFNVGDDEQCQR